MLQAVRALDDPNGLPRVAHTFGISPPGADGPLPTYLKRLVVREKDFHQFIGDLEKLSECQLKPVPFACDSAQPEVEQAAQDEPVSPCTLFKLRCHEAAEVRDPWNGVCLQSPYRDGQLEGVFEGEHDGSTEKDAAENEPPPEKAAAMEGACSPLLPKAAPEQCNRSNTAMPLRRRPPSAPEASQHASLALPRTPGMSRRLSTPWSSPQQRPAAEEISVRPMTPGRLRLRRTLQNPRPVPKEWLWTARSSFTRQSPEA